MQPRPPESLDYADPSIDALRPLDRHALLIVRIVAATIAVSYLGDIVYVGSTLLGAQPSLSEQAFWLFGIVPCLAILLRCLVARPPRAGDELMARRFSRRWWFAAGAVFALNAASTLLTFAPALDVAGPIRACLRSFDHLLQAGETALPLLLVPVIWGLAAGRAFRRLLWFSVAVVALHALSSLITVAAVFYVNGPTTGLPSAEAAARAWQALIASYRFPIMLIDHRDVTYTLVAALLLYARRHPTRALIRCAIGLAVAGMLYHTFGTGRWALSLWQLDPASMLRQAMYEVFRALKLCAPLALLAWFTFRYDDAGLRELAGLPPLPADDDLSPPLADPA